MMRTFLSLIATSLSLSLLTPGSSMCLAAGAPAVTPEEKQQSQAEEKGSKQNAKDEKKEPKARVSKGPMADGAKVRVSLPSGRSGKPDSRVRGAADAKRQTEDIRKTFDGDGLRGAQKQQAVKDDEPEGDSPNQPAEIQRQVKIGDAWSVGGVDRRYGGPKPPMPPAMSVAFAGAGHIVVLWQDGSSLERGFVVERQTYQGEKWSDPIETEIGSSREFVRMLVGAGQHRVRIAAFNDAGMSGFTEWSEINVPGQPLVLPPAAPTDPSATDIGNRRALVNWVDNSDDEDEFEIQRSPAFPWGLLTVGPDVTSHVDPTSSGAFSYRVRAKNSAGSSDWTSWVSVTIADTPPAKPTNVMVVDLGTGGDVRVVWEDQADNETGMRLERQTNTAGDWGDLRTFEVGENADSLEDSPGLGIHRYRIKAFNDDVDSGWTDWATITLTDGWTDLSPSDDSRLIYISASEGSDSNDGSIGSPVRTLKKARDLARHGYPDWMLFKRGDVFTAPNMATWKIEFPGWWKSGRSATEPMVFTTYGDPADPRPLFQVPDTDADGSGGGLKLSSGTNNIQRYYAVMGLHFRASPTTGTGKGGITLYCSEGSDLLIEDCVVDGFKDGISVQGGASPNRDGYFENLRIRRSIVMNCHSVNGAHSQGIYINQTDGVLIEECVIDTNGWLPGQYPTTAFNQNIYIQDHNRNCIARRNIIAGASNYGLQMRSGGIIEDNLFVRNPANLLFGGGDHIEDIPGVSGRVAGNVFIESVPRWLGGADYTQMGWGVNVLNVNADGVVIEDNIFCHDMNESNQFAVQLKMDGWGSGVGILSATVRDNIAYDWNNQIAAFSVRVPDGVQTLGDFTVQDNIWQDSQASYARMFNTTGGLAEFRLADILFERNTYHSVRDSGRWFKLGTDQPVDMSFDEWVAETNEPGAAEGVVVFPDPGRDVASYNASLGGADDYDAFMMEARQQSRSNWRSEYTAGAVIEYIRAGFGLDD